MADDRDYASVVLKEMLTTEGWREASARLRAILERTQVSIYRGKWVTPEQLRELALLQGQENFIRNLLEHPVETFDMGLAKEPEPPVQKPGVGQEKKRSRPPGFGV